jgi:hypothetical protein
MYMKCKKSAVSLIMVAAVFGYTQVEAGVLCAKKNGAVFERSSCKQNEREVQANQGPQGPQGVPGLAGIGDATCAEAMVGEWDAYLAGSAFNDIERCSLSISASGTPGGSCWIYLRGGSRVNITGGLIESVEIKGYKSCAISGDIKFSNGIKGTIDATMTPDQNNVIGVHWNTANGDGTFNATRLIK